MKKTLYTLAMGGIGLLLSSQLKGQVALRALEGGDFTSIKKFTFTGDFYSQKCPSGENSLPLKYTAEVTATGTGGTQKEADDMAEQIAYMKFNNMGQQEANNRRELCYGLPELPYPPRPLPPSQQAQNRN